MPQLEKEFERHTFQVFEKYEPYLQYFRTKQSDHFHKGDRQRVYSIEKVQHIVIITDILPTVVVFEFCLIFCNTRLLILKAFPESADALLLFIEKFSIERSAL